VQRIAVRSCPYDHLSTDVAAGARMAFDDELLAETLREPCPHQASKNIGRATWRGTENPAHRPRWVIERSCDVRQSRCSNACRKM